MQQDFSDYIIYADESGDHSLTKVDSNYPVFCLALCIIKKHDYIHHIVPAIQQLKFDYWGHDKVVLHEHELRRQTGNFSFLRKDKKVRQDFFHRITEIMTESPYWVVSSVIDKNKLKKQYTQPYNPYGDCCKSS